MVMRLKSHSPSRVSLVDSLGCLVHQHATRNDVPHARTDWEIRRRLAADHRHRHRRHP